MAGRIAAVALAVGLAVSGAAAQVELSPEEARGAAASLQAAGRTEDAARVAAALLQRDPTDASAWVVVARIRRDAGDTEGALDAARRANRSADTADERYAAAVELAAAHFLLERRILAQVWLRHAAQVAPTEALREAAIRNFRAVRAQTPWAFSFGFSVVPTSNVNNGSRAETIEIAGLPFVLSGDARALSGQEITASATARYRFEGIGGEPAQLSLSLAAQRVRLSETARQQAPDAEAADYAYEVVEFGFTQVARRWDEGAVLRFDVLAGRNRYGGDPLSNYARLGASLQWPVGARSFAGASVSAERQHRFDLEERSAWVTRADLRRVWQVGERGDALTLFGGVRRTRSESSEIDHRAALVGLDYGFGRPVLGPATLQAGLDLERRIYDASPYSIDGRQDTRVRLSATVGFPEWNYYGFAPSVTFEATRTLSNISLYDTEDLGLRLGVVSVF